MKVARGHILGGQGGGGESPPFNDSLAQFGQNWQEEYWKAYLN